MTFSFGPTLLLTQGEETRSNNIPRPALLLPKRPKAPAGMADYQHCKHGRLCNVSSLRVTGIYSAAANLRRGRLHRCATLLPPTYRQKMWSGWAEDVKTVKLELETDKLTQNTISRDHPTNLSDCLCSWPTSYSKHHSSMCNYLSLWSFRESHATL